MGLFKWLFGKSEKDAQDPWRPVAPDAPPKKGPKSIAELARRLGMSEADLTAVPVAYRAFEVPKRSGGKRTLHAPDAPLKTVQRRILRKLLKQLRAHPAAHGFERGRSIVTNAREHTDAAVVIRMDIRDFFPSISDERVRKYFRAVGWPKDAAELLTRLCTHKGGLPQGAPTSPRLSNLVNWELDARLSTLAASMSGVYTRYADDMAFSFMHDDPQTTRGLVGLARFIVEDVGYTLHTKKKLTIRRRHQQQKVTGLVVNDGVSVSRATRHWLRAVDHYTKVGKPTTLSATQRAGWEAFCNMVDADPP